MLPLYSRTYIARMDEENPSTTSAVKNKREKTVPSSPPSTLASSTTGNSPRSNITIDHQVTTNTNNRGSTARGFLLGMSKPVFALIAATVLATTGSAAWFFTEWLTIPGLKDQITALQIEVTRLEGQVTRLEGQVDRLSEEVSFLAVENDRFNALNSQLNQTAQEYQHLNEQLSVSTFQLSSLNEELNSSNSVFAELNAQLSSENEAYAGMNSKLNQTQHELSELNQDLLSIVSFLNTTSNNLQSNFESMLDFLAEQIDVHRFLVLEATRNTYQQRIQNWDCGYRDYFSTYTFVRNGNAVIQGDSGNQTSPTILSDVFEYVENQLLSSLCVTQDDLQDYLLTTVQSLDSITSNELIQGISRYTIMVMEYYFPDSTALRDSDGAGIRSDEWEDAAYRCANLMRPFVWEEQQNL